MQTWLIELFQIGKYECGQLRKKKIMEEYLWVTAPNLKASQCKC